MNNFIHTIAKASLFMGFSLLLYFCYAVFWPVHPLVIHNFISGTNEVQTDNTTYKLGQTIGYKLDYCKNTDAPVVVHRELVDGQTIELTSTTGYLLSGCHTTTVRTSMIPDTINPGTYYLDIKASYTINALRLPIVIHYHTNYFNVVR